GRQGATHNLHHGTTLHGQQWVDLETGLPIRAREPLTYYHREGPAGHFFQTVSSQGGLGRVGLVGLGVGALAAYAEEGEAYAFFEIDPAVIRIAEDQRYFTYISAARERGADVSIELGDARLALGEVEARSFDLLVLDAFSSDSIPVHLITLEAVELYLSRLREGGLLALHISNRYLDLEPVLAAIAEELGVLGLVSRDMSIGESESDETGRQRSHWVVLAREAVALRPLRSGSMWTPLEQVEGRLLWTDDYSNFLRVLKW
ncbi:MAG: fused MFS/spermidine synthase, partial [Myxococcota bacterium]